MATVPITDASTLTCLCRAISVPLTIVKHTTFPIPTELCHCNSCCYASGAIAGAFVELSSSPPEDILNQCVEYASSSKVRRYFCKQCGSKMFVRGWAPNIPIMWFAWAGIIERADDNTEVDTIKVEPQAFLEDTKDGGLVGRMLENHKVRDPAGQSVIEAQLQTVFCGGFDGPTMSLAETQQFYADCKARVSDHNSTADKLLAKCHCGHVQFHITRPDRTKEYTQANLYLNQNNTKYLGRLCVCRSCRAATGHPLHPWTYVPPEHIVRVDGQPIEFESVEGLARTAAVQARKDGDVTRSFCGTCGATVFYESADRPWVVDVSVGLLRSESGVLARDFLEWAWDDVSWSEECRARVLLDNVRDKK